MKATLVFLTGLLLAISSYGQGQVIFANTDSTLITTNSCCGGVGLFCYRMGPMTGVSAYRVGLYIAPFGVTDDYAFTLVALATNAGSFPPANLGRFSGGTVTIPGAPPGSLVAFQIRVWQTGAGATYEQAQGQCCVFLGKSARGFAILGPDPIPSFDPIPRLMGTNYGQVPGFIVYYRGGPYYGPNHQISDEFFCGFPPAMTNVALKISGAGSGGHTVSWNNNVTAYPATFLLEWTPSLPAPQWNAITTDVLNLNNRLNYSAPDSSARFYRLRQL
ncbi:MAG TPA: hypothetical protein VGF13_19555 [Verrucomicrobiae bacterium]